MKLAPPFSFVTLLCAFTATVAWGVPQPTFKAPVQLAGGGSTVVKIVSGKTVPKIVSGVDSGADVRQTLMLSGYTGAVDFVTADHDARRLRVRVQQNGAAGTTYATVDVTTTGHPTDLAVDNVSNHLADDLITAEDGVIRVYSNTRNPSTPGLPTFAAPVTLTANGTDGQPLVINKITTADVDQDGKPDIIGVGTILVDGVPQVQLAVFISTSTGTPSFAAPTVYTTSASGYRTSGDYVVAANLTTHAQVNGQPALDSFPEIIVGGNAGSAGNSANGSGYGEYAIFFNKGDGTFNTDAADTEYPFVKTIYHYLHGLDVGDVNGDGFRDLVTEESNDNTGGSFVGVYYGQANGYLGSGDSATGYLGTNTSRTFQGGVVIGDLNNDGTVDIGLAFEKKVFIYGLTAGSPQSGGNFPGSDGSIFDFDITAGTRALELTDSNHDGHLDLLIAENAPQELALVVNGQGTSGGGGTAPAGAPSAPVLSPSTIRLDQQITLTTNYTRTSTKDKVVFLYKSATAATFSKLGTATPVSGTTYQLSATLPALGDYTFKAEAVPPKPGAPVLSDESDTLTVTIPKLSVVSVVTAAGKTSGGVVVSGPIVPGLTLTLQASSDGSDFSDVPVSLTVNRAGRYILALPNVPTDLPYYRVISMLNGASVVSDNFSLYGVDALVALVTNDGTSTDDATLAVKTALFTGAGVVADDAPIIPARAALVPWGDYRTFVVQAKNTSKFTETISFNGKPANDDFSVNYLAAAGTATAPLIGSDVTTTVTTSGLPVTLSPGATARLYVRIHCYPGVKKGTLFRDEITCVVGGDTSHRDSVLAIGSATPALKVAFVTTGQLSGEGGLDNAIAYANAHPGTTIEFEVPSDDPSFTTVDNTPTLTYQFDHALAAITAAGTIIDATTEQDLGAFDNAPKILFAGRALPDAGGTRDLNSNGLTVMASNCVIKGLSIRGFNSGIYIGTPTTSHLETRGVVVQSCIFQGNLSAGVTIDHAMNNLIGGDAFVTSNYFRSLELDGTTYSVAGLVINNANGNLVQGNTFGLNYSQKDASAPHGFASAAIILSQGSAGNTIGGLNSLSRNVIAGNSSPTNNSPRYGIDVRSSNNIIEGNAIGVDGNGSYGLTAVPNDIGIVVESGYDVQDNETVTTGTLIGGATPGAGNTISGNNIGMILAAGSSNTRVFGNFIGTYPGGGASAIPNVTGIYLVGYNTQIGGSKPGQRNVISGNTGTGIFEDILSGSPAQQYNSILGNLIGGTTDKNHPLLSNGKYGIEVYGSVIQIGDDQKGEGNYLFNEKGNVVLHGPSSNAVAVRGNEFLGGSFQDIDLLGTTAQNSVGRTSNDANEADGLQNFPVLATVVKTKVKNTYVVSGTLHSSPNTTFVLDFYVGPDGDGVSAKHFANAISFKTDATGQYKFNGAVVAPAGSTDGGSPIQVWATASALIKLGATPYPSGVSEFSDPLPLP